MDGVGDADGEARKAQGIMRSESEETVVPLDDPRASPEWSLLSIDGEVSGKVVETGRSSFLDACRTCHQTRPASCWTVWGFEQVI